MHIDERRRLTESNRAAWNEVMPVHQRTAKERWDRLFSQPGYVSLASQELEQWRRIGVAGKRIAHLCCNNGRELLSLKNLGAGECVGFDISDVAIEEATERAARSQIECRYVRTDVYDIGPEYERQFDIAYMTAGCLGWLPDLPLFFAKAAALLHDGGRVFIHEIHPFADMLPEGATEEDRTLRIAWPYFKSEPYADQGGLDYVGNAAYESATTQYWFMHTLSDIIMGLVSNHISIEHFSEYEKARSPRQRWIEEKQAGIPLSYILLGRKQATGRQPDKG